jgi:hypothetical protein
MPPKKTAAKLRKALTRAENEEKKDQLELALQKAQEIKGHGNHPNVSELADEFNVLCSTLGHHLNGYISKRGAGIKCWLLPLEAEHAFVSFLEEAAGKKLLLRWFNEASDPDTLLQDLQKLNQAFSSPAPIQTCHQHCEILFSEDDGEQTNKDGLCNDWSSIHFISPCLIFLSCFLV